MNGLDASALCALPRFPALRVAARAAIIDSNKSRRVMEDVFAHPFNDFPTHDAFRCNFVNAGFRRWFGGYLTQFLDSPRFTGSVAERLANITAKKVDHSLHLIVALSRVDEEAVVVSSFV